MVMKRLTNAFAPHSAYHQQDHTGQLEQQARLRTALIIIRRLADFGPALADVRQGLVESIVTLPMESSTDGFERPLADLDRLAGQLDALHSELAQLLEPLLPSVLPPTPNATAPQK
jgi:hypothetical protein